MNETGYRNLMQLVSRAYLEGFYYKPRIDMDLLRKHHEGLIATSGCLSSVVCRAISNGMVETAWQKGGGVFAELFDDGRYYLEMQRHGIGDQDRVNSELIKMSVGPEPAARRDQRRPLPRVRATTSTTTRCSASGPRPTSMIRTGSGSTGTASM